MFFWVEVFQVISRTVRITRRLDVSPTDHVINAVSVAVGTTHAGGQMDVLVVNPLIPARRLDILRGVTVVAPVGRWFADDVEEDLVIRVKAALIVVCNDFVLRFRIVKFVQLGGRPLYRGQAAGHRGRPPVIFPGRLQRRVALVLFAVSVVTSETVDLVLPGDWPTQKLLRISVWIVIVWFHLAIVSTGKMTAELLEELPGSHVNIIRAVGALPVAIGNRDLCPDPGIGQHPRFTHPSTKDVGCT